MAPALARMAPAARSPAPSRRATAPVIVPPNDPADSIIMGKASASPAKDTAPS
jgi:hypothetical protein